MESERSLARNTLYSAISSASNVLLIVLVIAAARLLGDESFGQFSFALALASVFEMVIDLGLNTLTARNVARDRSLARVYLPNILGWKLILSVGAMGLLVLCANLLHQAPVARTAAYILGGAIVLRSFKGTAHAFFQAYERFDLILLTSYVERAAVLAFGILALVLTRSLIAFAAVFALVRIPDLLFTYWLVNRNVARVQIGLRVDTVKKLQRSAIPFGAYAITAVVYSYLGTIVLSALESPQEVGWYSAGYKVYEGLTMFPAVLGAVLLPRLSRLFTSDRERHTTLSVRVLKYLALSTLPILISFGILAEDLVVLLYGGDFLPATSVLRILLGAATLMFLNVVLNAILISANREKAVLWSAAGGLLAMGAANLILIPRYGMTGAAVSSVAGEVCILAALLANMRRYIFRVPAYSLTWRPALACISAGAVLFLSPAWASAASVLLFVTIYGLLLVLLRAFDAQDWSVIRNFVFSRSIAPR